MLGVTRADQFPTVDIAASGAQAEGSTNVFPGNIPGVPNDKVENYRLSADVFFELDLFGRLRRSTEAARAQLLATEEVQRSITISLVASVASTYMLLRDLDAQAEIARRTQRTRADSLAIIQARFDKGTVPKLDVNQAEIELAVADAAVAVAQRTVTQTENTLAILLGRNPGAIPRGLALDQQTLHDEINPRTQRLFDVLEQRLAGRTRSAAKRERLRRLAYTAWTSALGLVTMLGIADALDDPLIHSDEDTIEDLCRTFRDATLGGGVK